MGATWNLLSEDGVLITSRHEKLTPILLTPDPGDDPQLGKGRGYTNFYRWVGVLGSSFWVCVFIKGGLGVWLGIDRSIGRWID